jgi:hypothetical protein
LATFCLANNIPGFFLTARQVEIFGPGKSMSCFLCVMTFHTSTRSNLLLFGTSSNIIWIISSHLEIT